MDILKKQRLLIFVIIVLAVMNVVVLGSIWFGKAADNGRKFTDRGISRFENKLGLSNEQREKFRSLREVHFNKMDRITNDLKTTKKELVSLLAARSIDSAAREGKLNELVELHRQIEEEQFEHFYKTRNLCTPDQQIKFDSLMQRVAVKMYFNPRKKKRGKGRK